MNSAIMALVVLIAVAVTAGLVIVLLRPRSREGPKSENAAWLIQSGVAPGPPSHHDVSFHSTHFDASSHGGIDHGGTDGGGSSAP